MSRATDHFLAFGAKIYKMKFGHRGINQPVKDLKTGKFP
jgi:carbamoyl-phosphate synthase small subunit